MRISLVTERFVAIKMKDIVSGISLNNSHVS